MLTEQGGVCAICGKPPATRRLSVDHNHRTGQVRGLLCYYCNYFRVGKVATVELAKKVLAYLERAEASVTDDNLVTPGQTVDQG